MRLLAIGDIHGYLQALDALLDSVKPQGTDQFIFLGDYVDKGPDVRGVIDRLIDFAKQHHVIFLRGNHDQMLIDAYRDPEKLSVFECLGGENPLSSYGEGGTPSLLSRIPESHWEFLEGSRDYFETAEFIFVHGGIRPEIDPVDEDRERLQWTTLSLAAPHRSGRTVICGHSSQQSGLIADLGHTICVDTGIARGKWVTCLDVRTFAYWQSDAEGKCRDGVLRGQVTTV